jgi:hypothetical protein
MKIAFETETPNDSRTLFQVRIDERLVAEGLTAVQVHVLVGEVLERIALPQRSLRLKKAREYGLAPVV